MRIACRVSRKGRVARGAFLHMVQNHLVNRQHAPQAGMTTWCLYVFKRQVIG